MSRSPLRVDLYTYPLTIHLSGMSPQHIEQQARNIATNLHISTLFRSFYVSPRIFEHYNIKFSEKQVKRIDENFYDYSLGTRFRLYVPPGSLRGPPRRLRYLIRKSFSGDVSGDIGEALFAYFLIEEMNVNPGCIGHLRPDKRRGFLTPDFLVLDRSFNMASLLQKKKYPLPVLAEVKGSTGVIHWSRIKHALAQLEMLVVSGSLVGLLFMAVRNENRQGYDVYTVRVGK